MMMKTRLSILISFLLLQVLSATALRAAETLVVEVAEILKCEMTGEGPRYATAVLEISNPTDRTYYVHSRKLEKPGRSLEVKRGEKWLAWPQPWCPVGEKTAVFAFGPGAKMRVPVDVPETLPVGEFRVRVVFLDSADLKVAKVVSVWSRGIERKELGVSDAAPVDGKVKPEEPMSDEAVNKMAEEDRKMEQR